MIVQPVFAGSSKASNFLKKNVKTLQLLGRVASLLVIILINLETRCVFVCMYNNLPDLHEGTQRLVFFTCIYELELRFKVQEGLLQF